MRNPILKSVGGLLQQANDALAGLIAYAVTLNLVAVPAAALTAAINAFTNANAAFNAERTELGNRREALRLMTLNAINFVLLARDVLKPHLGKKHSHAWIQAGFLISLAVPRTVERLLPLFTSLATHFTANPGHENADLNVNAARIATFITDLTNARNAVNAQKTKVADALKARETQGSVITSMLRNLLKELSTRLDPMDNRYPTFGFNKPGQLVTPDMPTNVLALLIGPNAIAIKWNQSARAEYYRVWKKVVGVDAELIPVGSPADLDFALEGLPAGATVEIAISAVNNGGESAKTEVVTVTTAT